MPNFIINNYCNLQCPYCFAEKITYDTARAMTIDTFKEILSFLIRAERVDRIGLVGGEPTMHPEFKLFLAETSLFTKYFNVPSKLYTNGIFLDEYLERLPNQMEVLINTNTPDVIGIHKFEKIRTTIKHAKEMGMFDGTNENNNYIRLGCNIYPNLKDYNYIWEIIREFDIFELRMSVVSPFVDIKEYRTAEGKERYYNEIKPMFLQFCQDAIKNDIKLLADCNQIPPCYFTEDELDLISKAIRQHFTYTYCKPILDFHYDKTVTNCHGWNTKPISIYDFENINEIYRYFDVKCCPPIVAKNLGNNRCRDCKHGKLGKCCGGCPAFISYNN